mgnify:CR=1 FL=1
MVQKNIRTPVPLLFCGFSRAAVVRFSLFPCPWAVFLFSLPFSPHDKTPEAWLRGFPYSYSNLRIRL